MTDEQAAPSEGMVIAQQILAARAERAAKGETLPKPNTNRLCHACTERLTIASAAVFWVDDDFEPTELLRGLRFAAGGRFRLCPTCAGLLRDRRVGEWARRFDLPDSAIISELTADLLRLADNVEEEV